jgi:hypothetical protein
MGGPEMSAVNTHEITVHQVAIHHCFVDVDVRV